jgi:hypothetical protein
MTEMGCVTAYGLKAGIGRDDGPGERGEAVRAEKYASAGPERDRTDPTA